MHTDLDSLCSAVLLAYFRTHTPPHTLHIPLSNLPRADLALRPELSAVLRPAGLQPDDLLTLSDLPQGDNSLGPDQTRWLLVDHNAPAGPLSSLSASNLIGCIDHHEDEGVIPHDSLDGPRVIAKCGSCMSLVVDQSRAAWDNLASSSSSPPDSAIDAELAHLALGPILIDTINLTSKDKTTDLDISAVEFAEAKITTTTTTTTSPNSNKYDRAAFHDEIAHLKEDISSLTYRDIFRKDYKQWSEGGLKLGTSSVVQGFRYLTTPSNNNNNNNNNNKQLLYDEDSTRRSKSQFLSELKRWAAEQKLDIAAVMTTCMLEGQFSRELLVWAFGEQAAGVARQFAKRNENALGLETWNGGELDDAGHHDHHSEEGAGGARGGGEEGRREEEEEEGWRACWTQRRLECSRKQIAPLLREAMRDVAKL